MFSNFTEETCTGTGGTLSLAGATSGMLAFSVSFSDGDIVSYVVEDSAGTIKIAGLGTYNSAGNSILRDDTWNYNGTVVDKSPSTNIALSGGTHTIRCDIINNRILPVDHGLAGALPTYKHLNPPGAFKNTPSTEWTTVADTIQFSKYYIPGGITLDAMVLELSIGVDTSTSKVGFSRINPDGGIGGVLAETAVFNTGTADAGKITALLTSNYVADQPTFVYAWIVTDGAITILVHSRNEISSVMGVIDTCDNRGFSYGITRSTAPSAPTVPTSLTLTNPTGNASLAMLLRYL